MPKGNSRRHRRRPRAKHQSTSHQSASLLHNSASPALAVAHLASQNASAQNAGADVSKPVPTVITPYGSILLPDGSLGTPETIAQQLGYPSPGAAQSTLPSTPQSASIGGFGAPFQAPPNAIASSRVLQELALDAEAGGLMDLSADLMNMAQDAARSGGRVQFHLPTLHSQFAPAFAASPAEMRASATPGGKVLGGALPVGGKFQNLNPNGAGQFDLDAQPVMKAVAKKGFRSKGTPYRINEVLLGLGAYDGIRDPEQATNQTFAILQKIARNPIVQAIIATRISQVTRFAKIARHPREMGFEVRLKNPNQRLTPAARKAKEEIENIILHGGLLKLPNGEINRNLETGEPGVWNAAQTERAYGLRDTLAIETRHSLTMDWSVSYMEHGADRERWPCVYYSPLDSQMVRLTEPRFYNQPRLDPNLIRVSAVEINPYNSREVIREMTWETCSTMVRNPRTDALGRGYGIAETESYMESIYAHSLGLKFQNEHYDNTHLPYGVLFFKGLPSLASDAYMDMFRQEMMRSGGPGNYWNMLTMMFPMGPDGRSGEAQFVPFRTPATNELQHVLNFQQSQVTMLCAGYLMDPSEIGHESYSSKSGGLQEADPKSKLEHSQDKGLDPLLESHVARRNNHIVDRIDMDFEMALCGLSPETDEAREETAQKLFLRGWTPNKIAARNDEDPMKIPLDPLLYNQMLQKFEQQEFEVHEEYIAKVEKAYEKECKKLGMVKFWSAAPDLPVGNPTMMGIIQQEQGENQQAIAVANGQAPGAADPNAQMAGGPLPGQMPGQDPNAQDPNAQDPSAQDAGTQDPNAQDANAAQAGQGEPDPNADLQPHHYLSDRQPAEFLPQSDSGNGEPENGEPEESDEEKRDRFKRALLQRLQQQMTSDNPIRKAVSTLLHPDARPIHSLEEV